MIKEIYERYEKEKIEFNKRLREAQRVLVVGHIGLDLDRVGSSAAMAIYAVKMCEVDLDKITIYSSEGDLQYSKYAFLPYVYYMTSSVSVIEKYDMIIVLDCENLNRVGDLAESIRQKGKYIVNIDHHAKNEMFGHLNIVNNKASSTCEILYYLMEQELIDVDIATCLYTGIVADTGSFNHSLTPGTHFAVGYLLSYGIDYEWIKNHMTTPVTKEKIELWRMIYNKKRYYKGLAYVCWDQEDRNIFEDIFFDLDDVKINVHSRLRIIKDVKVTLQIHILNIDHTNSENNKFRLSFRTNQNCNINVHEFVEKYKGGGHMKAAGCEVFGITLEELKKDIFQFIDNVSV